MKQHETAFKLFWPRNALPMAERPDDGVSATSVFAAVEKAAEVLEDGFGWEALVSFADEHFTSEDRRRHINSHRQIIRSNEWYHGQELRLSHHKFLTEFRRVSIRYVEWGMDAWKFLAGASQDSLAEVHRKAWTAEGLRGQTGKRSPWGLDTRLDLTAESLQGLLSKVPALDIDESLYLLGSPTDRPFSAEIALLEDLTALRAYFPGPPSLQDLASAESSVQRLARRILRLHCGWSVAKLHCWYRDFEDLDHNQMDAMRSRRRSTDEGRRRLLQVIDSSVDEATGEEVRKLSREIRDLNQLNLALEPAFSFKGGFGLGFWGVFELGRKYSGADSVHLRQLDLEKSHITFRHLNKAVVN